MLREAIIRQKNVTLEQVKAYLPSNYTCRQLPADCRMGAGILIQGTDDHGWTLDGYVIPRLASGLIAAKEM